MTAMRIRKIVFILLLPVGILIQSCTRTAIEFGDNPENSYTNIVFTDTIEAKLSTVMIDSFETNGATSFLVGKYNDPFLGIISAKNFVQLTIPAETPEISSSAQYDSVCFIFHPNDYYYGDTGRLQTFYVNELSQSIIYSYNSKLYNTSNIPVKQSALGSKTIRVRPVTDDSIEIRLNDTKGFELFNKLQQSSTDVANADNFLNYFKGISLSTGDADTTAVYGLLGTAGSMVMRVFYHNTIPNPENKYVDFTSVENNYSFNQILADRSGTGIVSNGSGLTEIKSSGTNNLAYMQPGTALFLKIIFPSLKNIIVSGKEVKLLKAELIIRPSSHSFDNNKYKLPPRLYLTQTDASNISKGQIADSTGNAVMYANPVVDDLYGENNYYRFNISSYIAQLLATSGSEDNGFFVTNDFSISDMNVNRLIVNNALHGSQSTKLLLTLVVINK